MISLLIISSDKNQREEYAYNICKEHTISPFDITTVQPENSFGIEDVRQLQKKVYLSPLKGKEKACIILDAQVATIEAQNALLKLLEEPPLHTYLILTASAINPFLPTILSRCKVITLDTTIQKTDGNFSKEKEQISHLLTASISQKLYFAQELAKEKETALSKLEKLLYAARELMLENPTDTTTTQFAFALSQTFNKAQNTNINLRFLLEETFLELI